MPKATIPDPTADTGPEPEGSTAAVAKAGESATAGPPALREGDLLGGRFSLLRQIGRGGAGTVFSAFDTRVGQKIAVKVLHQDIRDAGQLERLRREVRASRPGHTNAVAVYDLFDDGSRRFLTMELVEGLSVSRRLAEADRLSVSETIALGRQIAAALRDLHGKGLVHRDVKPGNVLVTRSGTAKLCDMGLVRSTMRGGTITEAEMVVGTPAYMAPEQALAGDLTAASDVYALGLTLFQCLTGEVPLQEDTAVATLMLRQRSRPPKLRKLLPGCPKWLDRLIRRMLDPKPEERPTAAEVERALAEERVPFRLRPRRRHVLAASVVAVTIVGAVIGIRAIGRPPAASVEAVGSEIVGFDDAGDELWRQPLEQPRVEVLRADLDGDGIEEVLAVGTSDNTAKGLSRVVRHSEILVLKASGEVVTRIDPESEIGRWPYRYRLEVNPTLHAIDLDEDGWREVVAVCRQRRYFPTEVLVFWPRWNEWDNVLSHPGFIYEVFPPRDDSPPGFRFLGVNNRLAMFGVLGEMRVIPPNLRAAAVKGRASRTEAPPYGMLGVGPLGGLHDYVPLVQQQMSKGRAAMTLEGDPGGGWTVTMFSQATDLDAYLNWIHGPNTGRDLREMRGTFYNLIHAARPGFRTFTAEGLTTLRAEMVEECGPLLAEPVYETIFLEALGRALAWADDPEGAIELLQPAFERLRNDDLGYRLANLEAIAGRLDSAVSWLRILMDEGTTRRSGFDAPHLMLRVAIEGRDVDLVGSAVGFLTGTFREDPDGFEVKGVLWAGARLWWDETSEADARVVSLDYSEDGDAIGCLVRWRRGASRADDADAMRLFVENNPDAAGIGRVALAAALLGTGRAAEALEECDTAASMLGDWSKADFKEHQNLQLVRAIRTAALHAFGDHDLARREASKLEGQLNPDLLPGIVIAEVLEATAER
ncbi:MAG: serine/threonine-protein kinase [Candidatus Sulfomarinibacteraceae bacterium]